MTTTETPIAFEIGSKDMAEALQEARETLDAAGGEATLDLSALRRIDPRSLAAMEALAAEADKKGVRIVLRSVNVDVYRVLKLARLASRFSFVP